MLFDCVIRDTSPCLFVRLYLGKKKRPSVAKTHMYEEDDVLQIPVGKCQRFLRVWSVEKNDFKVIFHVRPPWVRFIRMQFIFACHQFKQFFKLSTRISIYDTNIENCLS